MRTPSDAPTLLHRTDQAYTLLARLRVYDRLRRWVLVTDPRIVRRFWPSPRDDALRPCCPLCGVTVLQRECVQAALQLPAGRAREALAAGGLEALTPDLPIEPGELWYLACLTCLDDRPRTQPDRWLPERLEALVAEALRAD